MRINRLSLALIVVTVLLGTCSVGCSKSGGPVPKVEEVTGKWVAVKKEAYTLGGGQQVGFVIEFFSDKTVLLPAGKGTWDILTDGRVKIELAGMAMHGSLHEKFLTVTMPDNQGMVVFKRQ
jgi:hypothetical protein